MGDARLEEWLSLTEAALEQCLAQTRAEMRRQLSALRGARRGAAGYRPTIGSLPAFISRNV